jgi:predicted flap endonuclease-1-like 5' DNA nuclease
MADLSEVAKQALQDAFAAKDAADAADTAEVQAKQAADEAAATHLALLTAERDAHLKASSAANNALTIIAGELGFQLPSPSPTPPPAPPTPDVSGGARPS